MSRNNDSGSLLTVRLSQSSPYPPIPYSATFHGLKTLGELPYTVSMNVGHRYQAKTSTDLLPQDDPVPIDAVVNLTEREKQVFNLLARGYQNKEVADKLGIAVKTAEKHRTKIYRRLNVDNIASIVHKALALGLVKPMFRL